MWHSCFSFIHRYMSMHTKVPFLINWQLCIQNQICIYKIHDNISHVTNVHSNEPKLMPNLRYINPNHMAHGSINQIILHWFCKHQSHFPALSSKMRSVSRPWINLQTRNINPAYPTVQARTCINKKIRKLQRWIPNRFSLTQCIAQLVFHLNM